MSDALYLKDSYLKEFTSIVRAAFDQDGTHLIVLDQTAFYPTGGGQPHDTGTIVAEDGTAYEVTDVKKTHYTQDGKNIPCIAHHVNKAGLQPGDKVTGRINWQRRYTLMRVHTAAHALCAIIHDNAGAKITGHQLGVEKSHVDFSLDTFDREQMQQFVEECNQLLQEGKQVTYYWMKREDALQDPALVKLAHVLPPEIEELRIVEIDGIDKQADGGTHVRNTRECGEIEILKQENKGKGRKRVYFTLKAQD